jgi:type II secretory pathway component HofQ
MPRRASLLVAAALIAMPSAGAAPPSEPRPPAARSIPVISLSVKDADLVEVVRSLARIAGVNVVIHPGVSGKVTAELVDVRWDHALAVILKTHGLAMELDGRILTVAEPRRILGAH